MKPRIFFCVLAMAASLVVASATSPTTGHLGAAPILLGIDSVRKELKLDSLQRAVLDSLRDEYKSEVRDLADPPPSTPAARAQAEKKFLEVTERFNRRSVGTLTPSQRKRFAEIENQVVGASVLYTRPVQQKLGLSAEQTKKIEEIRRNGLDYVGSINRRFEEGKIGYQDRVTLLRTRRLSQGELLLKVLTPQQRSAFVAMGGGKFSI